MWLVGIIVCFGWIFSLCLHEFSHAIVAYWGGDTAVKKKGYLTFNPLKYTDPGYSLVLPVLFLLMGGIGLPGGAVYINNHKLRNRWWQSAVSAAGPSANILIALLLAIPFWIFLDANTTSIYRLTEDSFLFSGLAFLLYLQVFAAVLNLLPIPGLDGYGIIEPWLSKPMQTQLNAFRKYSTLAIVILFWFVPWFSSFTFRVVRTIIDNFLNIPGDLVSVGSAAFRHPINQAIAISILIIIGWGLNSPENRWIQKGKSLIEKKQYPAAIELFDRAIKVNPDGEESWWQKGYCLWQIDRQAEAIECYQKVIAINEDNERAWLSVGILFFSLERYPDAISSLKKALELDSNNIDGYYYLGVSQQKNKAFELADETFDIALSISPKAENILNAKGALLYELKDYLTAIVTYQKLVDLEPKNATAWYDLACCHALEHNVDRAISCLQKAIELEPDALKQHARTDTDFTSLREESAFKQLFS
ncbi:tetratricopeptide repeat protein [Chamaesiphon sp. VAR_48_metabat_403]|uniref:tetratricopeptide repeat protein n=1 Tax=Chamaesiphon sp. VAR_48_metabat_403 TaxID=2964700 RepID=UPI00286E85AD|nr:tetratricopeptide repeat protein [Chamaesiphon sp. VAR_48_metabat_403]